LSSLRTKGRGRGGGRDGQVGMAKKKTRKKKK